MNITIAKQALDKIISKARVHLYKPIQIAEILYRDRVHQDIDILKLETYRNPSKKWRDSICLSFLGRTSTSSARYQDDIFNVNAIPPETLAILAEQNRIGNGVVEAYIYTKFNNRFSQMSTALSYCESQDKNTFSLSEFLDLFWSEPGLRRSIDKIYEIVVYALFSALIEALDLSVDIKINKEKLYILEDFADFAERVINLTAQQPELQLKAKINRAGITNASDRGIDMWANFGLAIQIKHLSLTEELAENIVSSVNSDRIVIVCKDSEQKIIVSLLNQLGWRSKIQSIITENDLISWYHKAFKGQHSEIIADNILSKIQEEIILEFPATNHDEFTAFFSNRGYERINDNFWK